MFAHCRVNSAELFPARGKYVLPLASSNKHMFFSFFIKEERLVPDLPAARYIKRNEGNCNTAGGCAITNVVLFCVTQQQIRDSPAPRFSANRASLAIRVSHFPTRVRVRFQCDCKKREINKPTDARHAIN